MAEPWIRYQRGGATRDFEPMFPSSFSGALKTLDENTAKPIRYATNEAIKTGKPWEFFKGLGKAYTEGVPDVSGKEIASNMGLSTKEYGKTDSKPLAYSGSGISESPFKTSQAGMVGFGLENLLDAENLIPAGKAVAVGGLALGGLKKVGKEVGENLLEQAKKFKNADEFIKAQRPEYVGHHKAPTKDGFHKPLNDVIGMYPDDIYTDKNAWHYYGDGSRPFEDKAMISLIKNLRNKPDEMIEVYRSVPKDKSIKELNYGDWISPNKNYAVEHGKREFGKDYKIIKKKVYADEVYTEGSSLHEWGYSPREKDPERLKQIWEQTQATQPLTNSQGRPVHPKDPNILKGLAPVGPWMLYQNKRHERTQNDRE